ncbi:MAG: cyanophycin synthetase [Candidatus Hydrothermales bacterium]
MKEYKYMKILEMRALRGPNIYHLRKPCIFMLIDIGELEERPTNKIKGFRENLEKTLPSIKTHRCSYGMEGGFLKRVEEGTWVGHVVEHIALELQCLAKMETTFGKTREYRKKGVYTVVFSYVVEEAGKKAGEFAIEITEKLVDGEIPDISNYINELLEIREKWALGPSTQAIVDEAKKRGIPVIRLWNEGNLVQLGYGKNSKRIWATTTHYTSNIGVEIACDKEITRKILQDCGIPTPRGSLVRSFEEAKEKVNEIGFPCVVKPVNGNHGKGVTAGVKNLKELKEAFKYARKYSKEVIIEEFVNGKDYRILVINGKAVACAQRTPAHVIGDGKKTIKELIDEVNSDERRGIGHEKPLTKIKIDEMTLEILKKKKLTLDSVLPKGEVLYLKTSANLSTGGEAEDVTDIAHPTNLNLAERVARIVGLDIAGIDFISEDITKPLFETKGKVVEVNAAPGFRMHIYPSKGKPRDISSYVIDMLFPPGKEARIPIISITGTNGKTTTVRMVAHILKLSGKRVGFTTTEGVYIGNDLIVKGDMTGPWSARLVLKDPSVEVAVFETARGGILREGLGYDKANIGAILNISEDHLGSKGIETVEEMAEVKSVVIETVMENGFAVLNSCDKLVRSLQDRTKAKRAFFCMEENDFFREHCERGGIGTLLQNGTIYIVKGDLRIPVIDIIDMPSSFWGKAKFNIENALAATLITFLSGVSIETISEGLRRFYPDFNENPGRANFISTGRWKIILDYAHNPAAYENIFSLFNFLKSDFKICILAAPGDRKDIYIEKMADIASRGKADLFILRDDEDLRGRKPLEVPKIFKRILLRNGIDESKIFIKKNEEEAIQFAMETAEGKEALILIIVENPEKAYSVIKKKKVELPI